MRDLRGSELNPDPLLDEDFERAVITPFYKVQIYKNGWQDVDDVTRVDVDFQGSSVDGVVSSSLNITISDTTAKYHPLASTIYSDYFSFRRKIRVLMGIKKDNMPYTWSYFIGNINSMKYNKTSNRTIDIQALDYCDILNTYKFNKNIYWGSTTDITILPNTYEYGMPPSCNGIHYVTKDGEEFNDWTYNWETNKFVITREELEGTVKVYYYTDQNVITVLQDILNMAGITQSLVYTPIDKTIKRTYFKEGTSALEAVKNLSQLVNYRFWFDGDGVPNFKPTPEVNETINFTFKDYKNIQAETVSIADKEFYNAVEVFGEERKRKLYYKEEVQLGNTVENYLDATVESRSHNFTFAGYGKLRYELECINKNGLTSELNETPTGAEIAVMHNPEQSREEEQTTLGYVTGSLFYSLSGGAITDTDTTKFLDHVPATRVKAVILDKYGTREYNKYGMQVSVTPESYWRTQLYLSHDPLRNLSETVQTIGHTTGKASPAGTTIIVPFTPGKIWGGIKHDSEYDNGWGDEEKTPTEHFYLYPGELERDVTVVIRAFNQGDIRWKIECPQNLPEGPLEVCVERTEAIPAGEVRDIPVTAPSGYGALEGFAEPTPESRRWVGRTFIARYDNTGGTKPLHTRTYIKGRLPAVIYTAEFAGVSGRMVNFTIRRTSDRGDVVSYGITIWSKRKPYNIKVTRSKVTETYAEFLAKCDFGSPDVEITCQGQEPAPRQYRVEVQGCKLVPRYYFLKLFGRKEVGELTSTIYSQKTLSEEDIQDTGGKKTLTIRNHLIQSQEEAEALAQNLLDHYQQVVNSLIIEVSCPPPLEVGDTVSIVSQY